MHMSSTRFPTLQVFASPWAWILLSHILPTILAFVPGSANWAEQGFYFDWNNASEPLPTPVTGESTSYPAIGHRLGRTMREDQYQIIQGVLEQGPDPTPEYVLKIYTSHYLTPFIIDAHDGLSTELPIPFEPGTQYVICMTDGTGISGGCQDLYTVYASGNSTCQNVTIPEQTLGVTMTSLYTGGLLSRFGWPASCSDLKFDIADGDEGVAGTPPYTLTVAPAFRTPVNITSGSSSVQWTVVLDHGHPFFVSISDSKGITWSNGPLHAGAGSLACFDPPGKNAWLTLPVSLGMSFSFLVLGFLVAFTFTWFMWRYRSIHFANDAVPRRYSIGREFKGTPNEQDYENTLRASGRYSTVALKRVSLSPLHLRRPSNNRASSSDMVLMPERVSRGTGAADLGSPIETSSSPPSQQTFGVERRKQSNDISASGAVVEGTSRPQMIRLHSNSTEDGGMDQNTLPIPYTSPSPFPSHSARASLNPPEPVQPDSTHEVYVVHHDAGLPPPVTVFTRPGTRVTELPPGYDNLLAPPPTGFTPPTSRENSTNQDATGKQRASFSTNRPSTHEVQSQPGPQITLGLVNAEDIQNSTVSPVTQNTRSTAEELALNAQRISTNTRRNRPLPQSPP